MQVRTFFLLGLTLWTISGETDDRPKFLSRSKRFLAFPEGSSFSAAICTTIGVIGNPVVEYLSWAVNYGVSYDLPNKTWILQQEEFSNFFKPTAAPEVNKRKPLDVAQRRDRRELYQKMEIIIDNMGFNGHECIARVICESTKHFTSRKGSMIEEMLKTVFKFPRRSVQTEEPEASRIYDRVTRRAREIPNCAEEYSGCSFSLLELALGKYSRNSVQLSPAMAIPFM